MPADRAQELLNDELRAMLARRRRSHRDMGVALGVSQTQISARLRGEAEWKFADLWTVAEWLDVPLSRLIAAVEAEAPAARVPA